MSEADATATAFVLLAAGNSSRMGTPKQLLDFRGRPLLRHAASVALDSGCSPVIVVLGAKEQELRTTLAGLPVEVVVNDRWAEGVGSSIQAGLGALASRSGVEGAVLSVSDQPLVTAEFLRSLVARRGTPGNKVVASRYAGTVGVPVYFAREAFPLLMALPPDKGCKGIILGLGDAASFVDCPDAAIDIDTPGDYQRVADSGRTSTD